jgi:DNA modification methylase/superfamily II DNA or RNA helicase
MTIQEQYRAFLESKRVGVEPSGISISRDVIHRRLKDFQRDLVAWAVRGGRRAIFADTGLGKTCMQLEWARLTGQRALIVAPLAVAQQTIQEAAYLDLDCRYARSQDEVSDGPSWITNYEMLDRFDPAQFGAVVLDESSILKALDGKTRRKLTEMFADTPYRLCCTATPAPNDITEIANHAEFLGIMTRVDMLAAFFLHETNKKNSDGWRLKRHAEQPFYRWLASWSMSLRKPSELGYSDAGYELPPLRVHPIIVDTEWCPEGQLFPGALHGIRDRLAARRATIAERVKWIADKVNADKSGDQWIIWCGLNEEADQICHEIPGSHQVSGSMDPEEKARLLLAFAAGEFEVLVTKLRIAGFGMNFQRCHNEAFLGLSDSWEQYYQGIRRCWRFGQEFPVDVYVVVSQAEQAVLQNIERKERDANRMRDNLMEHLVSYEKEEVAGIMAHGEYETGEAQGDGWKVMLGDSNERLAEVESDSVGLSVFSPPFMALYTYSPTERDLGNSTSPEQFWEHFGFIMRELYRATMPGRNCCVHVAQVPATVVHDGFTGLKDFRGETIRQFESRGWQYHGEVCIDKDPQAQAIRTHSKGLLFVQLRRDSSWLRPALADYILVFRKPGENPEPIHPDLTNEEWIEWARPIWYGIRETETLNIQEGRDGKDERHICPLQLGTIERCVRLWSNRGDLVLSPFAGIGSEGYVAVKHDRRFVGCELKRSYWDAAVRNLKRAEQAAGDNLLTGVGMVDVNDKPEETVAT